MAAKNVQLHRHNGTGFEELYPNVTAKSIPAGAIVGADGIAVERNASTGVVTVKGAASFVRTVGSSSYPWTGSAGSYSYSIPASTHGKGTAPRVRTYNAANEESYDNPKADASGNVTVYSNANVAVRVVIE